MNFLYATGISGIVLCVALIISGAIYQRSHEAASGSAVSANLLALESGLQVSISGYDSWVENDVPGNAAGILTADPGTRDLLTGRLTTACKNEADTLAPGQLPGRLATCSLPHFSSGDLGWTVVPYTSTADATTKVMFYTALMTNTGSPDAVALIAALKPKLDSTLQSGVYDPLTNKITDPTTSATLPDDLPATLTAQMNGDVKPGSVIIAVVKEYT